MRTTSLKCENGGPSLPSEESRTSPGGARSALPRTSSTVLLGQGLHSDLRGAAGQGEGESNPPPLTRDEAVQGRQQEPVGCWPLCPRPPQKEVHKRTLLPAVPHGKAIKTHTTQVLLVPAHLAPVQRLLIAPRSPFLFWCLSYWKPQHG